MSKKSLLAFILVAVMMLSGCSLVMKDQEVDNLLTIIDVNGSLVNKEVFLNTYEYNLYVEQYYASMLAAFGGDGSVDADEILQNTIETIVSSLVKSQKSAELGFDQLTVEDEAQVQAEGEIAYQEELDYIQEYYFATTELTGDELKAAVEEQAAAGGVTLEMMVDNARSNLISSRLRASVTDLVTITDEDIQAKLDTLIEQEKAAYENNIAAFGQVVNSSDAAIYYTPAGYRTIQLIEIAKPAEENAEDTAKSEIEALAARIQAGETFETLSDSIVTKAVCDSSTDLDAVVVEAAMRLSSAGDVSGVIETASSYVLIQYVEEIAEKTATLDEMRDSLYETVLTEKQDAAFEAAVASWIEAADVKIYAENINN